MFIMVIRLYYFFAFLPLPFYFFPASLDLGISRIRAARFANSTVTSDFLCKSTGVCLTVAELFLYLLLTIS